MNKKQQNSIVINGQRFKTHKDGDRAVLDGVTRTASALLSVPRGNSIAKPVHHAATKSQTLMRHAVKKPLQPKPHVQTRTSPVSQTAPIIVGQPSGAFFAHANPKRLDRAAHTDKSTLIRRFSDFSGATQKVVKAVARPLAAQPTTTSAITTPTAAPLVRHTAPLPVQQRPAERLVQRAMASATSHEQPAVTQPKMRARAARKLGTSTKLISFGAACLAVLLFGSFFAYQNVPNFAVRVAAARSGVKATLPGYKPGGFAMNGGIKYAAGQVTVAFKANADSSRKFTVTQKNSNWNSDSLLSNYVASTGKMYQTYQDKGRTIYIYDGTNATWVNGGVWYDIAGNSSLNSEQLVRIATSM